MIILQTTAAPVTCFKCNDTNCTTSQSPSTCQSSRGCWVSILNARVRLYYQYLCWIIITNTRAELVLPILVLGSGSSGF